MRRLGPTPSQTAGPYFHLKLDAAGQGDVAPDGTSGQRIVLTGRVLDGGRAPVEDALVEVWQADAEGRYHHPDDRWPGDGASFRGFGRCAGEHKTGRYAFRTVKPGRVADPAGGMQAPHLCLAVQGRGMLNPVFTRVYFSDEAEANAEDLVLSAVPAERRVTLIAEREDGPDGVTYHLDIRFQGEDETVFLEF